MIDQEELGAETSTSLSLDPLTGILEELLLNIESDVASKIDLSYELETS